MACLIALANLRNELLNLFNEILPSLLAIFGICLMPSIFPQAKILQSLDGYYRLFMGDENQRHFQSLRGVVLAHTLGWQVTVDLIYTLFALLVMLAGRLSNTTSGHAAMLLLIAILLLINIGLLAYCIRVGPANIEQENLMLPMGRATLSTLCAVFSYSANSGILAAIFWEHKISFYAQLVPLLHLISIL